MRIVCIIVPCFILAVLQAIFEFPRGVIPFALAMLAGEGVYKLLTKDKQNS